MPPNLLTNLTILAKKIHWNHAILCHHHYVYIMYHYVIHFGAIWLNPFVTTRRHDGFWFSYIIIPIFYLFSCNVNHFFYPFIAVNKTKISNQMYMIIKGGLSKWTCISQYQWFLCIYHFLPTKIDLGKKMISSWFRCLLYHLPHSEK